MCIKGEKCQYYTQVGKSLTMYILYTSGYKVKNDNFIPKWLKF